MRIPAYLFIISLCLSLSTFSRSLARQPVIDISDHNFMDDPILELSGEWAYSEGCLYPEVCESMELVDVPHERLDRLGLGSYGYGTYSVTILLDHQHSFMLKVLDQFSAYTIYVNGRMVAEVGSPGETRETTRPGRKVLYIPLHDLQSDTLRITVPISNFSHSKRGIGGAIFLGLEQEILHQKFLDDSYDSFLTGFLILATFFFLGLFFHGKQDYAILFFALFTLCYSYRIVGWHNYILHDMVSIPYRVGLALEYSTFYLSGAFFALYLERLFPEDAPKILTRSFAYFSLAWALPPILFPVHLFTQLNTTYLYVLLVGILLVIWIFTKAAINKRPGSGYSIFSVLGILLVFSFKSLSYLDVIDESRVFSIAGEMIFFTFQALILSRSFTENWRQAKKDAEELARAKSDFLSVMSHEIRTPLNAVIGTAYHLIESDPKEDQVDDLQRLKASSENLLLLINNVLDYNKIEAGKIDLDFTAVSLKSYCETEISLLQPLADQQGIKLELAYDAALPDHVMVDKVRLGQVLTNLIGNAIKFTREGNVIFGIKLLEQTGEEFVIQFSVEDTGSGISESDLSKIFGAFEQSNSSVSREYGGVGLGLAISQKLVELMGSTIKAQSKLGEGSYFSFVLKVKNGIPNFQKNEDSASVDLSRMKVLLVEDNEMNVLIARRQLQKHGIHVAVAYSGPEAISSVQSAAFDIILMDLQMPGMDGFETTKKLRELNYDGPIIALTAASVTGEELRSRHFDGMLPKPFSPDDLIGKLREFV